MRVLIIILLIFPMLGGISRAQTPSPLEASPSATASPGAGQDESMMGAPDRYPPWFGTCAQAHRRMRIVDFVLRGLASALRNFCLDGARYLSRSPEQAEALRIREARPRAVRINSRPLCLSVAIQGNGATDLSEAAPRRGRGGCPETGREGLTPPNAATDCR
jgi:hypothetical protein